MSDIKDSIPVTARLCYGI